MWSASALLGLRCPLLLYWSFTPHAGQCVMPMVCALASTCFLNCLCSLVLVLLTALPSLCSSCWCWVVACRSSRRDERLHRLTLLSLFSVLCSLFSVLCSLFCSSSLFFLSSLLCLWNGVCRVVRAQLCEHARNTTGAIVCCACLVVVRCVLPFICNVCCIPSWQCCCPHHALFTINDHHVHH